MSELKCPFCQQEIKIAGEHTTIMSCFNGDCKGSGLYGEKAFWQELIRTRKALEQSEICCTEWEKQALDYKAENIALSGDLERTRKALEIAVDALKRIDKTRSGIKENLHATNGRTLNAGNGFCWATIDDIHNAIEQITALEQKDVK